jgi:hypothetical protein
MKKFGSGKVLLSIKVEVPIKLLATVWFLGDFAPVLKSDHVCMAKQDHHNVFWGQQITGSMAE